MNNTINLIILLGTIAGGSYLFLFEQDSLLTTSIAALGGLGWVLMLLFAKKRQHGKDPKNKSSQNQERIDPDELVKRSQQQK